MIPETASQDAHALMERICALAREAGHVVMDIYEQDFKVLRKEDASPVTEADRLAEAVILEGLSRITPGLPVVAEEEMAAGRVPDIRGKRFWLVDPLDGTKEFVRRNGEFTVNIALIEDGAPILGVVHVPGLGETFTGIAPGRTPGRAYVRRKGGESRRIAVRPMPEDGPVVLSSRSHADGESLGAYLRKNHIRPQRLESLGSSLKFCRIAEGRADLYPRMGPTSEWDTAAGQAVLVAAGGAVRTLDGLPLTYGKPDFRNPDFVAVGGSATS